MNPSNTNFRPLMIVGGVPLPAPSNYNSNTADFVDAARNVEGITIGTVVRADVAKVEMRWQYIEAQAWANMLGLFKQTASGRFFNTCTYYDQTTNDWDTRVLYVSDRNASMFLRDRRGRVRGYTQARIALIQV